MPRRLAPALAFAIPLALALALRLAYLADHRADPTWDSPLVDAWVYDRDARRIAADGPGALETPYYQPPGYPLALGAVYAATGGSWLAPRLLQALLGVLTVGLAATLAARAAGGLPPRSRPGAIAAAAVAGALLATYGPAIYFEGELLPPALILALDAAALVLLAGADRSTRPGPGAAAAGLLLGLSTIVRPTALLLAAAAAAWWIAGGRAPARLRALAVGAVALALPITPVTLANRLGGGEAILVSWNGGINFWLGNGAGSDSLVAIQPGWGWDRLQVEPLRAGVRSRSGESRWWTRRALREARADPAAWVATLGRKALRLLDARETARNTDYEAARETSRVLALPLTGFGLLAPLAVLGLAGVRRRRGEGRDGRDDEGRRTRALLGAAIAAIAVENLLFFPTGRYRLEAVPALAALAGAGVAGLDAAWRGPRRALVGRIALVAAVAIVVHVDWLGDRGIDRARVAINRGVAHRRADRDALARAAFREALRLAPDDPDAHRWLGEMALGEGRPDEAMAHFEAALRAAPDYVRVLLGAAQALELAGRAAEAEPYYRRAAAADPFAVDVRLNWGVNLARAGRFAEARAQFETGLAIDPDEPRLLRNLARLDQRTGGHDPSGEGPHRGEAPNES